ncbi:tautomerase family protein [Frigidibacter sp. MR17.14]|uniref:tautomerase family protein n=1 Tax=Frigidibacter sp. MR17.14 TaxID=3126509 RepID=UPI0030130812
MPHVVIHVAAGRTPDEKSDLTRALTDALGRSLGSAEDHVSVEIIDEADWPQFYRAQIGPKLDTLNKRPGYSF